MDTRNGHRSKRSKQYLRMLLYPHISSFSSSRSISIIVTEYQLIYKTTLTYIGTSVALYGPAFLKLFLFYCPSPCGIKLPFVITDTSICYSITSNQQQGIPGCNTLTATVLIKYRLASCQPSQTTVLITCRGLLLPLSPLTTINHSLPPQENS